MYSGTYLEEKLSRRMKSSRINNILVPFWILILNLQSRRNSLDFQFFSFQDKNNLQFKIIAIWSVIKKLIDINFLIFKGSLAIFFKNFKDQRLHSHFTFHATCHWFEIIARPGSLASFYLALFIVTLLLLRFLMRFLFIITSLLLRLVENSWEIARSSFSFRCETFFSPSKRVKISSGYRIQFREKQGAKYLNILLLNYIITPYKYSFPLLIFFKFIRIFIIIYEWKFPIRT